MTTILGRPRALGGLLASLILCSACGQQAATDADHLRTILHDTALQPRVISYVDVTPTGTVQVEASVSDDYRYAARLTVDGVPAYQEVADDDALAARVLAPTAFDILGRAGSPAAPTTALALKAGRWVLDGSGAPSIGVPGAGDGHRAVGADPILDALSVLTTVESEMRQGAGVTLFDPSSLTYRPKLDPFPKPNAGAHEMRYDLTPVPLPKFAQSGVAGYRALPTLANFLHLSVYVVSGHVSRILERVEITPEQAAEVRAKYALKVDSNLTGVDLAAADLAAINAAYAKVGTDPLVPHSLSVTFSAVGSSVAVALPTGETNGSLRMFRDRGRPAPTTAGTPSPTPSPSP